MRAVGGGSFIHGGEQPLLPRFAFAGQGLLTELLARALDREPLRVEQTPDSQHHFDIVLAVEPMAGGALRRAQRREFGLPVTKHVSLGVRELADLANAEVKLVGDEDVVRRRLASTTSTSCRVTGHSLRQSPIATHPGPGRAPEMKPSRSVERSTCGARLAGRR